MDQNDLLDQRQTAARLGLKNHNTLAEWRHLGKGPNYVKIGSNVRYRASDIEKFLAANVVETGGAA